MTLPYPPPFQDAAQLAQHISVSVRTLENWVKQGLLPPPKKIGGKRLWQWKEVEKHLARSTEAAAGLEDKIVSIREATRAAARANH